MSLLLAQQIVEALPRLACGDGSGRLYADELCVALALASGPARSVQALAESLGLPVASTSELASELASRGLVAVERDRFDHRKRTVSLTAKGQRLLRCVPGRRSVVRAVRAPENDQEAGRVLRAARAAADVSQSELAEGMRCHKVRVRRIEGGRVAVRAEVESEYRAGLALVLARRRLAA